MVPTPTLTASASSSAISASDSPGQLLAAVGPEPVAAAAAARCAGPATARVPGSPAAPAPRRAAAPRARQILQSGNRRTRAGMPAAANTASASALWNISQRRCACCQACGCAAASTGSRIALIRLAAAAASAPSTLMAMPASHHSRLERQLPRNLRAIEPAQGGRDIGQQRAGDEVAADEARRGPRPAPATPVRSPARR